MIREKSWIGSAAGKQGPGFRARNRVFTRVHDALCALNPGYLLALNLDPIYVGAHHLVRFLVVSLAIAVAARRFGGRASKPVSRRWQRPGRGAFED